MQCKDIPDQPIISLLERLNGRWATYWESDEAQGGMPSIVPAMPAGTPEKLRRAKMGMLIRRGLVNGCTCGCRGDFEITEKGREYLKKLSALTDSPPA